MSPEIFAQEFRTVHVRCRRQIGHTNLINQLSYNIKSPLGMKYSTIIVTPKRTMADSMYGQRAAYFSPEDQYETTRVYANEYRNAMRAISNPVVQFDLGKIVTAQQTSNAGFKSKEFIEFNKHVMEQLTHIDMTNKKIDLVCVDCASMLSKDQLRCIYDHFSNTVELFLLLE